MAANTTALSVAQKAQFLSYLTQSHEANEKRFVSKSPVADIAALKAITTPEEGERRQITTANEFLEYVYSTGNTSPDETCTDGSAGGWIITTPTSAPEYWTAATDYVADDMFAFESATDEVDREGNEIKAGTLYMGRYIDAAGDAEAVTSGASLDTAEFAKMQVIHGEIPGVAAITQAEVDGIILIN